MEHLLLKATITAATDEGTFTAVISTVTVDRDRDIVEPNAVVEALHKWTPTGKKVPLSWNHSVKAEDIVGHVDPASAKNVNGEVVVDGWVDQSFERGQHAWRLVKSGTLGFSYGYLVTKADKRRGGGLHIKGLDIFEITATPIPANGDTRVLGWKAMYVVAASSRMRELADKVTSDDPPTPEEIADRMREMAAAVDDMMPAKTIQELQEVKDRLAQAEQAVTDLKEKAAKADEAPTARSVDPLKQDAMKAALDVLTGGAEPPHSVTKETPKQVPEIDPDELRKQSRDLMLQVLTGN